MYVFKGTLKKKSKYTKKSFTYYSSIYILKKECYFAVSL